jgi:hypothetical protein
MLNTVSEVVVNTGALFGNVSTSMIEEAAEWLRPYENASTFT